MGKDAGPVPADTTSLPPGQPVGFHVAEVKLLPNDVSAFITPVRDLNGDACALLKVVAPPDFAFSSPLGIVKRTDEVGEIWLYLPHGTKRITLKHPQWGVLRDYRFAHPLESHMVYEMRVALPKPKAIHTRDTIIFTQTVTDTIVVDRHKPRLPWRMHGVFTVSFHGNGPSWGILFAMMRRHGFFLHAQSDFRRIGPTTQSCNQDGYLPGSEVKPYYTGRTRRSSLAFTAGLSHWLWPWLGIFYGAGYGRSSVAWELSESEGGGYVLNKGLSAKGLTAEAGLLFSYKRICLSASALTVTGEQWQASIGIGIKI